MIRISLLGLLVPGLCLFAADEAKDVQPEEIIKKFAAKEADFAKARENYTYRQSVKIQELSPSGAPEGQYEIISDIIFSSDGKRTEKVIRAPVSTLHLLLDPGDEQDLRNVQPFVLTTTQIPEYDIRYLGKQKVDEISCYQFSVKPKKLEKGKRYFEGEIWVDDRDLQIVKTYGKGVGLLKRGADNQYPRFETYRILVPHLHPRRRHAALQRHEPAAPHDREVRGLQAVQEQRHCHIRRRGQGPQPEEIDANN
jgi:hypothetical protein